MFLFNQVSLHTQSQLTNYYSRYYTLPALVVAKVLLKVNPAIRWKDAEMCFVMIDENDIQAFETISGLLMLPHS